MTPRRSKRKGKASKKVRGRSRHSKTKGRALQNWVAQMVGKTVGMAVGHDCPIESRRMGEDGVDIRLSQRARHAFPFSIECKNTEAWSLPSAIKQAKDNCYPNTAWLVVLKKNQHEPVVCMDAELFFDAMMPLLDYCSSGRVCISWDHWNKRTRLMQVFKEEGGEE